jgi:hypothetical protein
MQRPSVYGCDVCKKANAVGRVAVLMYQAQKEQDSERIRELVRTALTALERAGRQHA